MLHSTDYAFRWRLRRALKQYKTRHPDDKTPLYHFMLLCNAPSHRMRHESIIAAQRVGFNVMVANGHVYENFVKIWSINGNCAEEVKN